MTSSLTFSDVQKLFKYKKKGPRILSVIQEDGGGNIVMYNLLKHKDDNEVCLTSKAEVEERNDNAAAAKGVIRPIRLLLRSNCQSVKSDE